jgi:hypothetical protein
MMRTVAFPAAEAGLGADTVKLLGWSFGAAPYRANSTHSKNPHTQATPAIPGPLCGKKKDW